MSYLTKYNAANLDQLMDRIMRNSIGMDDYLSHLFTYESKSNYPPYNVVSIDEHTSKLEVALAGFTEKEINVYTQDSKLTVVGSKAEKEENQYVHRGLAQRSFNRSWTLSEDTEVTEVVFEYGLLTVTLKRIVPEKHQKKVWYGSEEE